MIIKYILSVIISIYLWLIFFKKLNLKKNYTDIREVDYELVPYGLTVLKLIIIITISLIPLVNYIFAVFIIVYPFFTFEDLDKIYSNIKVYPVIKKILNFLNKPI